MGVMGIRPTMPEARRIAEGLIGVPFLDGGRDPGEGLDCWGVVLEFYRRRFGVNVPDPASLDPETCEAALVCSWFVPIRVGDAKDGDVLRFASNRCDCGKGRHLGIKIGRAQVLHPTTKEVVVHSMQLYTFDAAFRLARREREE